MSSKPEHGATMGNEIDGISFRMHYLIKIKGSLSDIWKDYFEQMEILHSDGITIITGPVEGQSELHGMLSKIRDLGLIILSVKCLNTEA